MEYQAEPRANGDEIGALFTATFTASEGAEEGALIGRLAGAMTETTAPADLFTFTARDGGVLAGCILFSRLRYDGDPRQVFVLGPVAVATARQGEGVGQRLIAFGLAALRAEGIDVAVTYGDPAFYTKVGFAPITEADVPTPFPLAHPEGWLGQSLTAQPLAPIAGPAQCVAALNDPEFW